MRSFARSGIRLVIPMVASAVVLLWIAFLKVFALNPMVGKPPSAVWDYLFTAKQAAANRATVLGNLMVTLRDASLGFTADMIAAIVLALTFAWCAGSSRRSCRWPCCCARCRWSR